MEVVARAAESPEMSPGTGIDCELPGSFACVEYDDKSATVVCRPQHEWLVTAVCGGPNCCKTGPPCTTAFCSCGPSPSENLNSTIPAIDVRGSNVTIEGVTRRDLPLPIVQPPTPHLYCDNPGTFGCGLQNDKAVVVVCSPNHQWEVSAICGAPGCCHLGPQPGVAYCSCSPSASDKDSSVPATLPASDIPISNVEVIEVAARGERTAPPNCYYPESLECMNPDGNGQAVLVICREGHHLEVFKVCGPPGCCKNGARVGEAYCTCGGSASDNVDTSDTISASDESISHVEVAPRSEEKLAVGDYLSLEQLAWSPHQLPWYCPNIGEYRCSVTVGEDCIVICADSHRWKISAICAGLNCCQEGPTPRTAFCACGASASDNNTATIEGSPAPETSLSTREEPGMVSCFNVGERVCRSTDINGVIRWDVYVCSAEKQYVLASVCGVSIHCCLNGANGAYCACAPSPSAFDELPGSETALSSRSDTRSILTGNGWPCDNPGWFICGTNDPFGLTDWNVYVCSPQKEWVLSSVCGGPPNCCRSNGITAYCTCAPSASEEASASTAGLSTRSDEVDDAACDKVGDTTCITSERGELTHWDLYTCNSEQQWALAQECGGGLNCCGYPKEGGQLQCLCSPKDSFGEVAATEDGSPTGVTVSARGELTKPKPSVNPDFKNFCFRPGSYTCAMLSNKSHILVCGPDNKWQVSAVCGPPECCRWAWELEVPQWTAFCFCGPQAEAEENTADIDAPSTGPTLSVRGEVLTPGNLECTPGTYTCFDSPFASILYVCNAQGKKKKSTDCGNPGCCMEGPTPGTAFCTCAPQADDSTPPLNLDESKPASGDTTLAKRQGSSCPTPGAYACRIDRTNQRVGVFVCSAMGEWQLSALCGGSGPLCCKQDSPETAHCVCSPKPQAELELPSSPADFKTLENPQEYNPPSPPSPVSPADDIGKPCSPAGYYKCDNCNNQGSSCVVMCNAANKWQLSASCSGQYCCKHVGKGSAVCFCGPVENVFGPPQTTFVTSAIPKVSAA